MSLELKLILPLESFLRDPLERSQNVITTRFLQSTEAKISLKGKEGKDRTPHQRRFLSP